MAKAIKELVEIGLGPGGSAELNPAILFEAVTNPADNEGLYARKVSFSQLENYAADGGRGDDAPVVKAIRVAKDESDGRTDRLLKEGASGAESGYFDGLDGDLKGTGNPSVISALNAENARAKEVETGGQTLDGVLQGKLDSASLAHAVVDEHDKRVLREGPEGEPIASLFQGKTPGNILDAFKDIAAKNGAQDERDEEHTSRLNVLYGIIGFNSDGVLPITVIENFGTLANVINKIGVLGNLITANRNTIVEAINAVYAEAASNPVLEDGNGDSSLEGTGKSTDDPLKIKPEGVVTGLIKDGAVTEDKLDSDAVTENKIEDGAVTEDKIEDGAVTGAKLADNAVSTARISDYAVTEDKLDSDAVTENKIADGAVTTGKLSDGAVTENKIEDGSISNVKLYDGVITTVKIEDGAVTEGKIEDGAVTGAKLADNAVSTARISDYAVTEDKLDSDAVTENKIEDGAVTEDKIEDGAVTGAKLAAAVADEIAKIGGMETGIATVTGDVADIKANPFVGFADGLPADGDYVIRITGGVITLASA